MFWKLTYLLLAIAIMLSPARAERFSFEYAANELQTTVAATALYDRLVGEAEDYCEGLLAGRRTGFYQFEVKQCVRVQVRIVVNKINHSRLNEIASMREER